jgi:enoyl-[acyl-carrier-protein] reductase (NADH)
MERAGVAEDLAGTAIFLASSASDCVTGQVVFMDGGSIAGSFSDKKVGKKGCFIAGGG